MKNLKIFGLAALVSCGLVSCSDSTDTTEVLVPPTETTLLSTTGFESEAFVVTVGTTALNVEIQPFFYDDNSFDIFVNYDELVSRASLAEDEEEEVEEPEYFNISGEYTYDAKSGVLTLIHQTYEEDPIAVPIEEVKAFTVKADKDGDAVKFPFTLKQNAAGEIVATGDIAGYIQWGIGLKDTPKVTNTIVLKKGTALPIAQ